MNSDTKTAAGGQRAIFVLIFWNIFTIIWTAWISMKVEGDFHPLNLIGEWSNSIFWF
jgi:hypothetical protein